MIQASKHILVVVTGLLLLSCYNIVPTSQARVVSRSLSPTSKVKAVNLGGWLVTEGWIKPSLFDGIPNKNFTDGAGVQFKSVTLGKFLSAESGGGTIIVANRTVASGWETFIVWRINQNTFNFKVFNKQFLGLDTAGNAVDLVAVSNTNGVSQTFQIVKSSSNPNRVRVKAPNGLFLQVKTEVLITADNKGDGTWGDDDPSVFELTFTERPPQGEYQVTNGYGPIIGSIIMKEHWRTFIVEDDFKFISTNGINAVRIPVGWWIASDPSPPKPYVGGSLSALDNAFKWAEKYGINVIIDLHAARGSQNPFDHSSSRDGTQDWGKTDQHIQVTVPVINFLAARYARSPRLYAVELLNEPMGPGVNVSMLSKYYKAGYDAVRKHTSNAYVILSNRLSGDEQELFTLAKGMTRAVIDVHYYNLFWDKFDDMTAQQNIDFIYNNRSGELASISTSTGPLILVGEWVAEWSWRLREAPKEDYQRFAKAELEVFGRATFGWAYWTLKHVEPHWSLEWMIKNGYITI